ncbi:MAG: chemotaxis protein CheW [Spirochaetaceae bacterium]|jgi:purine-binding chemotaxis protein CheW|nr:chemotaxis protein CheW [Spirochaetaceae bacterium]
MEEIQTKQFLTFNVKDEVFALKVEGVQEVLEMPRITRVPRMPAFLRGIINLRGSVVPVIDLSEKMGLGSVVQSIDTSVVVVEMDLDHEKVVLGLLCDAVDEVINLYPQDIEPPPQVGHSVDNSYINGMGKVGDNFVIILNIAKVIDDGSLEKLAESY